MSPRAVKLLEMVSKVIQPVVNLLLLPTLSIFAVIPDGGVPLVYTVIVSREIVFRRESDGMSLAALHRTLVRLRVAGFVFSIPIVSAPLFIDLISLLISISILITFPLLFLLKRPTFAKNRTETPARTYYTPSSC